MAIKESWCEIHPKQYALSSGLCTHLDCIKKIIWTHAKSWKIINKNWSYIVKLGAADDCCVFLIQELLREEKEQGKKPTLNPWWLKFRLQKYVASGLRKSNLPMSKVPKNSRTKLYRIMNSIDAIKEANADLLDSMVWHGAMRSGEAEDIEEEYEKRQLKEKIYLKFGESVLLYITDEIRKKEYIKLMATGIAPAMEYLQLAKRHIKHFMTEGEWLESVDDDIKRWKLSHSVDHRI